MKYALHCPKCRGLMIQPEGDFPSLKCADPICGWSYDRRKPSETNPILHRYKLIPYGYLELPPLDSKIPHKMKHYNIYDFIYAIEHAEIEESVEVGDDFVFLTRDDFEKLNKGD